MGLESFGFLGRVIAGRPRLFIGVICGLLANFAVPQGLGWVTQSVLVWDIGVGVYLILAAHLFLTEPPDEMAAHAARQEEGEWTIFALTVMAVSASFVAILGQFAEMRNTTGSARSLHVALVAGTLFISWLMTHTSFAFRYAHEYYGMENGGPEIDGGLTFPGEGRPDYLDFFYFALVLGMTFQVSDVQITSRKFRRVATLHGLLGFLFNTIILALTVNLAASLL